MKESYIRKLIKILENSKIDSLYITSFWGMKTIKLSKNANKDNSSSTKEIINLSSSTNPQIIEDNSSQDQNVADDKQNLIKKDSQLLENHIITAPLVGTYYSSSKPGEPAFINIGDKISVGQTICIIEAMKIFNEIESEVSGTVIEIFAEDSNPVEYGQNLFSLQLND